MEAPEVPPLCRETQSLGQQMLNATVGINESCINKTLRSNRRERTTCSLHLPARTAQLSFPSLLPLLPLPLLPLPLLSLPPPSILSSILETSTLLCHHLAYICIYVFRIYVLLYIRICIIRISLCRYTYMYIYVYLRWHHLAYAISVCGNIYTHIYIPY